MAVVQYGITVALITWSAAAEQPELQIGTMETFKPLDPDSFVFHMEKDLFIEGNIIFSDSSCIKTTNGTSLDLIVGQCSERGLQDGVGSQAKFNIITGFSQINKTFLVAADYYNNCLRSVDRVTNETNVFIGACSFESNKDLPFFVKFLNNKLYVSYQKSSQVRIIDWSAKRVVQVLSTGLRNSSGMCILQEKLITSNWNYLLISNLLNTSSYISTGVNEPGFKNGEFKEARFYYPLQIACPSTSVIFVADSLNHRIRFLDMNLQTVSSICDGTNSTRNGDTNTCQLNQPLSLLLDEHLLYIGQVGSIRKITVFKVSENIEETTYPTTQSFTPQNFTLPIQKLVEEPLTIINWHIVIPLGTSTVLLLIICTVLIGCLVKKKSTENREPNINTTQFDQPPFQHQGFKRYNPLYQSRTDSSDTPSENGESHQYEECRSVIPHCQAPDRPGKTIRSVNMVSKRDLQNEDIPMIPEDELQDFSRNNNCFPSDSNYCYQMENQNEVKMKVRSTL